MKSHFHCLSKLSLTLGCCLALTHCASTGEGTAQGSGNSPYTYLKKAAQANASQQDYYRLKASSAFLAQQHATDAAKDTLKQLSPDAATQFPNLYTLVQAQLQQAKQPQRALRTLAHTNIPALAPEEQRIARQTQSQAAWQSRDYALGVEAASQWIQQDGNQPAQQHALHNLWKQIQNLPSSSLQALASNPQTTVQAWGQLGLLAKQPMTYQALYTSLQQWKQRYAQTLPNRLLPDSTQEPTYARPQRIALLLPLSGRYASSAEAIKRGFFAAYYMQKNEGYTPDIRVYDTEKQSIQNTYKQAVAQGAQWIIGPLTKNNVAHLSNIRLTVPTISLNETPDTHPQKQLIQFALSPLDEARQAANQALKAGDRRALVFAPDTAWGKKVTHAFTQAWQTQGGRIVNIAYYPPSGAQLHHVVEQSLLVDQSIARKRQLQRMLGRNLRFNPRKRHDAGMVFLVGSTQTASQIRPFLRYYFAGSWPVYAISNVNNAQALAHPNDLKGLQFCDLPWLIKPEQLSNTLHTMQSNSHTLWQNQSVAQKRLYAMGIDAFRIMTHWQRLHALPQFGLNGATGTLFLTPQGRIQRLLPWQQV